MITREQAQVLERAYAALSAAAFAHPSASDDIGTQCSEAAKELRQYIEQQAEDASPPFGSKRAAALALYRPPFKFRGGYIHDAGGHMVADQDGFGEGSKVFDSIAARVRGWGRIGYMPDPEALQDEVGAIIADALTAYWSEAIRAAMAQER